MRKDNLIIAIIGLGYVGLPLANAFSKKYKVIGFDKNENKIRNYKNGIDITKEIGNRELSKSNIIFTSNKNDIKDANVYIIAVPTPIDVSNKPYIQDTLDATELVGSVLKKGDMVIYESTFYPGLTEEECIPLLEKKSNMIQKENFYVGYSPERINPGDKMHKLENITKIVSGIDKQSLELVYKLYKTILMKEPFKVSSIKVAEACKVIENTQRDLNIAFMNEISILLKKLNINTNEVLEACMTKWNFVNFKPGLVGGHCIGIDPYYLIEKAKKTNVNLSIIENSRKVNESMKQYIIEELLKKMRENSKKIKKSVIIYGATFKENISDIRNSKILEIAKELTIIGIKVYITDPYININYINKEYNMNLYDIKECKEKVQGIIIGVAHNKYKQITENDLIEKLENNMCPIIDIYGIVKKNKNSKIWSL